MTELVDFEEAQKRTYGENVDLLIGNGFSSRFFSYKNLLSESGIEEGTPIKRLFDILNTVDFELVIRSLEDAVFVEKAYEHVSHSEELEKAAMDVREALVHAVRKTHPGHKDDLSDQFDSVTAFIAKFRNIFTLNYDLLLYWVILETGKFSDGFGLGEEIGKFRGPFKEDAHCKIFNLHGGLHLFQINDGSVFKHLKSEAGIIDGISQTILSKKRLPIYVAEGTHLAKLRKINSVPYLRYCYEKLQSSDGNMFVYGHSADDNDTHIYRAIFSSEISHVYFGVYRPDDDKLAEMDGRMAKYQKIGRKNIPYTFFDSESAEVWGA